VQRDTFVAVAGQVFTPLFLFLFQSRSSQERERDSLRTSQEKLNYGPRTSQELARGGLRSSQEKGRTRGNQQEDRTTREKRERREDIIQKIINMQRVNEESEGDIIRSNSTSPSPSFSSTSSSPVSSSPSSSSSSPLSSPLSSPSHSRNPSGNSSDLFYHSNDDNGVLYGSKAARRDNGLKMKQGTRAPKHTIVSDKGLMLTVDALDRLGQKPLTCRQINPISYGPLVRHATPWAARCQRRPKCLAIRTGTRWRSRWTMTYGRFVAWFVPFPHSGSYSSQLKEEEDDDMDPELKAQQDREVEEFRRRLEQINNTVRLPLGQTSAIALSLSPSSTACLICSVQTIQRPRMPLPSTLSVALSVTVDTLKG